jgi:23S rRNA pseudouridine1911/1915/1917 synthase
MPSIIKSLRIAANAPVELLKADRAVQSLVEVSRSQIVGLFDHGCVTVNGQPCPDPWRRLIAGDTVEVRYDSSRRYARRKAAVRPLGFEIVFEDEQLIVVNKPADCLTTPSPRGETNALIDRVANYLSGNGESKHNRRRQTVFAVSRLDRGVSGVLVFAKCSEAFAHLKRQFAAHAPQREYMAIVAGRLPESEGTFRSHLTTSKSLKRYSIVIEGDDQSGDEDGDAGGGTPHGELAITHFRVLKRLRDATVVSVRLETGRRNQIRVHFAEAGHPVLGDPRYEPELAAHPRWRAGRIALHARALEIEHPLTRKKCNFEVALPEEFGRFIGPR